MIIVLYKILFCFSRSTRVVAIVGCVCPLGVRLDPIFGPFRLIVYLKHNKKVSMMQDENGLTIDFYLSVGLSLSSFSIVFLIILKTIKHSRRSISKTCVDDNINT